MKGFLSILKTIGTTVLGIEHAAAPIAEALLPAASPIIAEVDTLFTRLQSAIVTVEAHSPVGTAGTLKADIVAQDFDAGLSATQGILALTGKKIVYDAALFAKARDLQVAAYNAMAELKDTFKVVDIPKPA